MDNRCASCPIRGRESDPALVIWAWFNLVVDQPTLPSPDPEDVEAQQYLLENTCRQADIALSEADRGEALLVVQAIMQCFRRKETGECAEGTANT